MSNREMYQINYIRSHHTSGCNLFNTLISYHHKQHRNQMDGEPVQGVSSYVTTQRRRSFVFRMALIWCFLTDRQNLQDHLQWSLPESVDLAVESPSFLYVGLSFLSKADTSPDLGRCFLLALGLLLMYSSAWCVGGDEDLIGGLAGGIWAEMKGWRKSNQQYLKSKLGCSGHSSH